MSVIHFIKVLEKRWLHCEQNNDSDADADGNINGFKYT